MNVQVDNRPPRRPIPWVMAGLLGGIVGAILLVGGWTAVKGGNATAGALPSAPPTTAAAQTESPSTQPLVRGTLPDFTALVDRFGPAVVNISVTGTIKTAGGPQVPDFPGFGPDDPFRQFFRNLPRQPRDVPMRGEGSGFIVDPNGIVLTNAHVVNDAKEVTVKLTDRREFTARVLGKDTASDVAVLKIEARNLPTVHLGRTDDVKVG